MADKDNYVNLQHAIYSLLKQHKVVTATFVSDCLQIVRQKILWHLNRLQAEGLCHHAMTVRNGSRHYVWALGASTDLTEDQIRETIFRQLAGYQVRIPENTPCKTTFVNGINPWTGAAMK